MSSIATSPSSRARSLWVKCETPTTGRAYFIHRRTGKISWSDPISIAPTNADSHGSPVKPASGCVGTGLSRVPAWTSVETRQLQVFFKRWTHRGQLKVFTQWKLFVLQDRVMDQLKLERQKHSELKNSFTLHKAQSELAIERVQAETWKKADEKKKLTLKRSALRRLKKWINGRHQLLTGSFDLWIRHTNQSRMLQLNELIRTSHRDRSERSSSDGAEMIAQRAEWKARFSRQIELIAELQADVESLHSAKEQLAAKTEEYNKVQQKYKTEKKNWRRRFQMQQELIERLEHDVEELSELKVLELAENYYDGT